MNPNAFRLTSVPSGTTSTAVVASAESTSYLVFEVDAQPYTCPIDQIEHLMRFEDVLLRPSPAGAPAWELGRLETEEEPEGMPAVSLRVLWGLPPLADATSQERQAILIVNLAGHRHALLVDGCRCVLAKLPPGASRFHFPSALKGAKGRAFHLATPWEKSLLVVLDLDELLLPAQSASHSLAPVVVESR